MDNRLELIIDGKQEGQSTVDRITQFSGRHRIAESKAPRGIDWSDGDDIALACTIKPKPSPPSRGGPIVVRKSSALGSTESFLGNIFLTAGVDVTEGRIEIQIREWQAQNPA